MPYEDATFNQRRALFNMYSALKWDLKPIRKMSKQEASIAIDKAKKEIEEKGFSQIDHSEEESLI